MNIVHLCQYYMPGQTYQENYLPRSMARLGHSVTVIAGTKDPDFYKGQKRLNGETILDGPVRVRYTDIVYRSLYTPVPGLGALLDAEKPDLIFVHGFILTRCPQLKRYADAHPEVILGADTHETWVLAFNACFTRSPKDRLRRCLYFGIVYPAWRRWTERRFVKIFYVTPPRRKYAIEAYGYHEESLAPLWLGADLRTLPYADKPALRRSLREELGLPEDAGIILHAGKLDEKKRTRELIGAFRRLEGDWHLLLVGSMTPDLEAYCAGMARENGRIHPLGLKSGEETLRLIAGADIAAYPGAHSVLWEQTAALGIPAVYCSPEEGDAEYLSDDSAAFVRTGDEEEILRALRSLTSRREELPEMGKRVRALAERTLDYDRLAEDCLRMLAPREENRA